MAKKDSQNEKRREIRAEGYRPRDRSSEKHLSIRAAKEYGMAKKGTNRSHGNDGGPSLLAWGQEVLKKGPIVDK